MDDEAFHAHLNMQDGMIFISYARSDRDLVVPFFEWLVGQGFDVWMDYVSIKPGQNWDFEIKRAFEKATFVLAFVSHESVNRRGYVQRELKLALDKLAERLDDDIYIIPVLLDDDVEIPTKLRSIQAIRSSEPNCKEQIVDSIRHQLERIGAKRQEVQEEKQLAWSSTVRREAWEGLPGYEVEIQLLDFRSNEYSNIGEITEYIQANLLQGLFSYRSVKLEQDVERFNYGQDTYRRTDTYDAHCEEPNIIGKVLSVAYTIDWYGAGAAHPNHHFETYNFLLEPVVLIDSLERIFKDSDAAFPTVQKIVRDELYKVKLGGDENDEPWELDRDGIDGGTQEWKDFASFIFKPDAIRVLFAPYHVAAYACGPQFADVPYAEIFTLMKDAYVSALDLERLKWENPSVAARA